MKRFLFLIFPWIYTTVFAAVPSLNFFENFYQEFLCEQRQYLALNQITSPPPTGYVPFTIVNNSTFSDSQIFVLILTNTFTNIITFAPNADGLVVGSNVTPPPKTYVSQSGSGSYPLNTFLTTSGSYVFYLPSTVDLTSSRIYYSVGEPLDWFIPASGPVLVPSQDFADPTQDGYYILFDKQEFTMVANDRFVMNPTLVDYYGLPLSFTINYSDYAQNPVVPAVAYAGLPPTLLSSTIFTNYTTAASALTTGTTSTWSSLYLSYTSPSGGGPAIPLRVLSPSQAIQTTSTALGSVPLFPIDYFLDNTDTSCQWISKVWYNSSPEAIYQMQDLYIDLSTAGPTYGVAQGVMDGSGTFTFTAVSGTGTGSTLVLPLPTSSRAFFTSTLSDYAPATTSTGDPNVATAVWQGLSAGVMSGIVPILGTTQTDPLSQTYVREQPLFTNNVNVGCDGPWYDFYSGTFISMGSGSYTKFYTTPYGDYLGTDGTVTVTDISNANANVSITIGSMTGLSVPNPFDDTNNYTVNFDDLPGGITVTFGTSPDFASNPTVTSGGPPFDNVLGSTMYMGVTYGSGTYAGLWGTHIIPSGPAPKPVLPGGLTLTLSGGPGGTLTISLGASP